VKLKIVEWIDRLSTHFNAPQEDEQIKIFLHALRNNTTYQLDIAFDRCLNECQFMPKLSEVHQRIPGERQPRGNSGGFVLNGPPTLDLIRPIVEEICKDVTGREYSSLNALVPGDARLIHDLFFQAGRIRYTRMGINTKKWPRLESLEAKIRKPAMALEQQKNILRQKGYLSQGTREPGQEG
jgi:hypothetical protein